MALETFGPFVVPAVVFLVGVLFYGVVVAWNRLRGGDDAVDSGEYGERKD